MTRESSKSKAHWGELEWACLVGEGIDIGCGDDPVLPTAMPFDQPQGDANHITRFVDRRFDYVYSSHCLEHMHDPVATVREWWQLVRPGGVMFITVPDEDLYEQGFWPSRFNQDHKATFTISKSSSWSPVSVNLLPLLSALPGAEIVSVVLQDQGYDRKCLSDGSRVGSVGYRIKTARGQLLYWIARLLPIDRKRLKRVFLRPVDQTRTSGALAQIQCIVRKARPA